MLSKILAAPPPGLHRVPALDCLTLAEPASFGAACRVEAEDRQQFDMAADKAGLCLSDWTRDRLIKVVRKELFRQRS